MSKTRWTIGIDEVGRGSLAGPVVVCALAIPAHTSLRNTHPLSLRGAAATKQSLPLRDSKKLSASQRERWAAWVKTHPHIRYAVARVYPRGIERLNISQAANLAATRACVRLCAQLSLRGRRTKQSYNNVVGLLRFARNDGSSPRVNVLLDGGLYLRVNPRCYPHLRHGFGGQARLSASTFFRVNPRCYPRLSASTIIKGDEKYTAIKLASIVAKVARDKFMNKLHARYPQYGFSIHKGYGTKRHIAAIKKYGPSEIHRATFVKNFVA